MLPCPGFGVRRLARVAAKQNYRTARAVVESVFPRTGERTEAKMTWDPYGMPNSPAKMQSENQKRPLPEREPASMRTVAVVLGVMVLLALVFTFAANAQQEQSEAATQEEQQAQTEQQQEQGQQSQAATQEQEPQSETAATGQASESEAQTSETAEAPAAPVEGQIVEQPEGTYVASELIGRTVMSAEGEDMGEISDLIIGEDNHQIRAVVVGIGGFLGIGEKPIAVEISQLSRTTTQDGAEQLALNYTRTELEQAPEFVTLAELLQQQEAAQAQQQQEMQQQQQQEEMQQQQQQSSGGSGQSSSQY